MKKNRINTEELKRTIPYGGIKEVALRSKVSVYTVSNVVKGRSKNATVIKELHNYLKEVANKETELNQIVNNINQVCVC